MIFLPDTMSRRPTTDHGYCDTASFPDHHLSKSVRHPHECRTPHLALGAGGAWLPLPERMDARTLGSTPSILDPCVIDVSRLPASGRRRILRIAMHVHRRTPAPGTPASAGLSNDLEWECEVMHGCA